MNENSNQLAVILQDGTRETVDVRELPISKMPDYLTAFDDEVTQAVLFSGKDEAWALQLTAQSHYDLMVKGEALNRPNLDPWYQRRMRRVELLNPGFAQRAEALIVRAGQEAANKTISEESGLA